MYSINVNSQAGFSNWIPKQAMEATEGIMNMSSMNTFTEAAIALNIITNGSKCWELQWTMLSIGNLERKKLENKEREDENKGSYYSGMHKHDGNWLQGREVLKVTSSAP